MMEAGRGGPGRRFIRSRGRPDQSSEQGRRKKKSPHIASPGQQDEGVLTVRLLPEPRLLTSPDPHLLRSLDVADHLMWPLWPLSPLILTEIIWPELMLPL